MIMGLFIKLRVYIPQQNGIAQRQNRHLLVVARMILLHMFVPKMFWSDTLLTACFLINRAPHLLNGKSPFQIMFPNENIFSIPPKVFGCYCFVHLHNVHHKLSPKAVTYILIRYSRTQKRYKCYDPIGRRMFVSADVTFFEATP